MRQFGVDKLESTIRGRQRPVGRLEQANQANWSKQIGVKQIGVEQIEANWSKALNRSQGEAASRQIGARQLRVMEKRKNSIDEIVNCADAECELNVLKTELNVLKPDLSEHSVMSCEFDGKVVGTTLKNNIFYTFH